MRKSGKKLSGFFYYYFLAGTKIVLMLFFLRKKDWTIKSSLYGFMWKLLN